MEENPNTITYFIDRTWTLKASLFFLGFAVALLPFHLYLALQTSRASYFSSIEKAVSSYIGLVGSVLFAILAVETFRKRRLYSEEPYFVISPEGILDKVTGAGWIAWEEVAEVRLVELGKVSYAEIAMHDRETFLGRLTWWQRLDQGHPFGYPVVKLAAGPLSVDLAVVIEQMQAYLAAYRLLSEEPKDAVSLF